MRPQTDSTMVPGAAIGRARRSAARLGLLVVLAFGARAALAQQAPAPAAGGPPPEVKVTTTLLGGSVYGIDGRGGRMAALVGSDGVLLVDAQFPDVTDKIVAAIKGITPSPLRFLVNTHVHGDHTGGNENFAKLGVTILGRPELRAQQLTPRPAPNGQTPPVAPAAALPIILFENPTTIELDGEEVQLIPLPPAHTDGDTAVLFKKANVLMTGDVFRSEGMPAAAIGNGGSVLGILKCIDLFLQLSDATTKVVPGHGPVANREALVFHRQVLVTVRDRVAKAKAEGKTLEQVQAMKPTAEFDQRVGGPPAFIPQFVATLYNELPAR
ncbi:MAG TPA: MBL fold metallo-hydrolase [Gammaproteobacteria bacterium]|nr:MBL fold metallo-hydrolase [Gammaproteobacteria bacterium]